jgi:hypothetical protein
MAPWLIPCGLAASSVAPHAHESPSRPLVAFIKKITLSHLGPVLDTLKYLRHETDVWFEITNLLIPDENDSADELKAMCDWIATELGPDVPVHFTAFHPDFRMTNKQNTPHETLLKAHAIAAIPAAARPLQSSMLELQALSAEHCRIIQRIAQQVVAAAVLDLPIQDSLFAPLGTMAQQQVYGLCGGRCRHGLRRRCPPARTRR